MMDDLISRQAAIEVLNSYDLIDGYTDKEEIKGQIERLPSAQKIGRWEYPPTNGVRPFGDDTVYCSNCGFFTVWDNNYNYCPNCGAKMEERDDADT